jgi:hypothetical protein
MEYWNHGFWDNGMVGLENQNKYNCIDLQQSLNKSHQGRDFIVPENLTLLSS